MRFGSGCALQEGDHVVGGERHLGRVGGVEELLPDHPEVGHRHDAEGHRDPEGAQPPRASRARAVPATSRGEEAEAAPPGGGRRAARSRRRPAAAVSIAPTRASATTPPAIHGTRSSAPAGACPPAAPPPLARSIREPLQRERRHRDQRERHDEEGERRRPELLGPGQQGVVEPVERRVAPERDRQHEGAQPQRRTTSRGCRASSRTPSARSTERSAPTYSVWSLKPFAPW